MQVAQDRNLSVRGVVDFSFFVIFEYPITLCFRYFWCSLATNDLYCEASKARLSQADSELELWLAAAWTIPVVCIIAFVGLTGLHGFLFTHCQNSLHESSP